MSDESFREIQLSGKQLVFLFMASVVLAVVVFLLGVSVGRGVRENTGVEPATATATATDLAPPKELPPPTEIASADTQYDNTLQGKVTPAPLPPPQASDSPDTVSPADAAPITEPVPERPTPPAVERQPPAPAPAPATQKPPAPPATAKPAPAPAADGWFLQVNAFRSRENADAQVKQLAAKGYTAFVAPGGSLFRVRVGPFPDRAAADRTAARLRNEEGLKPSVTR